MAVGIGRRMDEVIPDCARISGCDSIPTTDAHTATGGACGDAQRAIKCSLVTPNNKLTLVLARNTI